MSRVLGSTTCADVQENSLQKFLTALWPSLGESDTAALPEGALTFWFAPSKLSGHVPMKNLMAALPDIVAELKKRNEDGENVYFSLGLRELGLPEKKRGGKKNVTALCGYCLDIDFAHPTAHQAKNIPRGEADALKILAPFPPPTIVIKTGHGWHCYWLFRKSLVLKNAYERTKAQKDYKAFQSQFIARANTFGWHVDHTAGIERVWRLPGFVNQKSGAAVEIEHLSAPGEHRYDQAKLIESIETTEPSTPATVKSLKKPPMPGDPGISESDPEDVKKLREALSKLAPDNANKEAMNALLLGESFADAERDYAMQKLASTIVWMPEAQSIGIDDLAELFRSSLQVWANETDGDRPEHLRGREVKTLGEELKKVRDKLLRARQDYIDFQEKRRAQLEPIRLAMRFNTGNTAGDDGDDGDDDPKKSDPVFLQKNSILLYKSGFWVWHFTHKKYFGPKTSTELKTYLRDAWEDAPAGFELHYLNSKGGLSEKTESRLLHEYGRNVDDARGSLYLQETYLDDDENVLYEASAPLVPLTPRYDKDIATWLKLLAGDEKSHNKLLDWLACVTRLDRQCCLLYLNGASGAGKGLLAQGVAKLWGSEPTELEAVSTDGFNDQILDCPFLFLDEGGSINSVEIRKLLGRSSFTYNAKNLPKRKIKGCIRLLIAANNDQVLLNDRDNMSIQDMEASVKRILHLKAHQEASDWLVENNEGNKLTGSWVDDSLIARHCLWLQENRTVKTGKRFLVEGEDMGDMHRNQLMNGDQAGTVYEWITRFLSNPDLLYSAYKTAHRIPLAIVGKEEVLIRTEALIDCWDTYMGTDIRRPPTSAIKRTLEKISTGQKRPRVRADDRPRYRIIRFDLIAGWAADNQVGDELAMRRNYLGEIAV